MTDDEVTPAHDTAQADKGSKIISLLIAQGADIELKNNADETPLHIAVFNENVGATQALLEHEANTGVKINGENLLHLRAKIPHKNEENYIETIRALIGENTSLLTEKNDAGDIPLHYYVSNYHNIDMVSLFLSNNLINIPNHEGNTALHLALQRQKKSQLNLLTIY